MSTSPLLAVRHRLLVPLSVLLAATALGACGTESASSCSGTVCKVTLEGEGASITLGENTFDDLEVRLEDAAIDDRTSRAFATVEVGGQPLRLEQGARASTREARVQATGVEDDEVELRLERR